MSKENKKSDSIVPKGEEESPSPHVFDLEHLRNFSNGDEEFINEMLKTFLKEIPNLLEILETSIAKEEWALVHNPAHRLKSNFMMLGMKIQQSHAETIEQMVKKNDIDKVKFESLTKEIQEAVKVIFPLLTQHIKMNK